MVLSMASVHVVKATAGVVADHAVKITTTFYDKMFKNDPEVQAFFNKAHQVEGKQPRALADSVVQYALNIEDLEPIKPMVLRIAHRHCALSVKPEHYGIVHRNMMASIGDVLGKAVTPEIGQGWNEAVLNLAEILTHTEEELYRKAEARVGGWRYEREFYVANKDFPAEDTVSLKFKPCDGYKGTFDYNPGQYTTIRIPQTCAAPRHYCLSRPPMKENALQVIIRRQPGGVYSNYMYQHLKVGDKVLLGAPFGVWGPKELDESRELDHQIGKRNMAVVAGGVGISPMLSFLQTYGMDRVKGGLFVNRTSARTILKEEFQKFSPDPNVFKFVTTREAGGSRPDLDQEASRLISLAGKDGDFFICGNAFFMDDMSKALNKQGAQNVFLNIYGTGTVATNMESAASNQPTCPIVTPKVARNVIPKGCPMHAMQSRV